MTTYYKTPQEYLEEMALALQAANSPLNDFTLGSATRTLLEAVGSVLSTQSLVLDQVLLDAYLDTATGDALDLLGGNFGITRVPAQQSVGSILVSRPAVGDAINVPAGWSHLASYPAPGMQSVAVLTTEDIVLGASDLSVVVQAQAVTGGAVGNLNSGLGFGDPLKFLPTSPVSGIASDGGFTAASNFTGGTDAETDDAFRERIRYAVQSVNRNGTEAAFLAATLAVPGVLSAQVLKAGDTRWDATTVPAGEVEIRYEGDSGAAAAVQTACEGAAVLNQTIDAALSPSIAAVIDVTVIARAGEDTVALDAAVTTAIEEHLAAHGVGETVYYSRTAEVVRSVPGVLSVNIPFTDHRMTGEADNTAHDLVIGAGRVVYDEFNSIAVTVTTI